MGSSLAGAMTLVQQAGVSFVDVAILRFLLLGFMKAFQDRPWRGKRGRLNIVGALTGASESRRPPGFTRNVITRMPHRRHTLLQIGWGNQRQLGSDGAADVPGLMILKSPGVSYRRGFF